MSISLIRPYVTKQLTTLGYIEWDDAFGEDNIPSTLVDRAFHQRMGRISGVGLNQETLEYITTFEIKIYFKGFNNPEQAVDQSLIECEGVIVKMLDIVDYTTAGIKGITFNALNVDPFDQTLNDNLVVATLEFDARVFSCL